VKYLFSLAALVAVACGVQATHYDVVAVAKAKAVRVNVVRNVNVVRKARVAVVRDAHCYDAVEVVEVVRQAPVAKITKTVTTETTTFNASSTATVRRVRFK
jgi:hypothetical protein